MEIASKQITETLKETIGEKEVYYQYTYDEKTPKLMNIVNFRLQNADGTSLQGSYSAGQVNINGSVKSEEFEIIPNILQSMVKIIADIQAATGKK